MIDEAIIIDKASEINEKLSSSNKLEANWMFIKGRGLVFMVYHNDEVIYQDSHRSKVISFLDGIEYALNLKE